MRSLPITDSTWSELVIANQQAVSHGWAQKGVFGTGIGTDYWSGKLRLLYIGKSAGPLGSDLGSYHDQAIACNASTGWMSRRENRRSAFWQFIEKIDPLRREIAWTNVCKMDRKGGGKPPGKNEWGSVSTVCMKALTEEIQFLDPAIIVFATSEDYRANIQMLLSKLNFHEQALGFDDGYTRLTSSTSSHAIETKHPQGWKREDRDRVLNQIRELLL